MVCSNKKDGVSHGGLKNDQLCSLKIQNLASKIQNPKISEIIMIVLPEHHSQLQRATNGNKLHCNVVSNSVRKRIGEKK